MTTLHDSSRSDDARASHGVFWLEPDGGEQLHFLGASTLRLKLADDATPDIGFYEYVSEPGVSGPPQHVHHGHDETFYVVDGTYNFTIDTNHTPLAPGGFLFIPRGTPHTFYNAGDGLGRIVGTITPGRFAHYFRELAAIIEATGSPPDHDIWADLYGRYQTTFHTVPGS